VVSLTEAGFFDPGQAELKQASEVVLEANRGISAQHPQPHPIEVIRIQPPSIRRAFPRIGNFSTERATLLLSYLTSHYAFIPRGCPWPGTASIGPSLPTIRPRAGR